MAKYKPVPRTLSEVVRHISNSPAPTPLVSPEDLRKTAEVPFIDPKQLFKNKNIRPEKKKPSEMRPPEAVFGNQVIAAPGKELQSLETLLEKGKKKPK